MRHKVAHRKLGRKTEHRLSLLRNLCASLIVHERLITTLPKAKELRPFAERAITLGKRALNSEAPEAALHARRQAAAYFHGDGAEMALIELIGSEAKVTHEEEKKDEKKRRGFFGRRKKAELKEGVPQEQPARKPAAKSKKSAGAEAPAKSAGMKKSGGAARKTQGRKKEAGQ
jgi:hypothetical protein